MKLGALFKTVGSKISESSPDLLVGVGLVSLVAAGAMAIVETRKLDDILDEQAEKHNQITEHHSEEEAQLPAVKREHAKVTINTIGRVAWNYKYTIGLTALGTTSILGGFRIIKVRYIKKVAECQAVAAGARAIQKAFDTAMDRVQEKWGRSGYNYAKYGLETEEYTETETDEDGKKKKVKKECYIETPDSFQTSPWTIVFDPTTFLYEQFGGSIPNMMNALQKYEDKLNEQYCAGVPIFYNDIVNKIEGLNSPFICDEGQVYGWYKHDQDNRADGDDKILLRIQTFNGCDPETGDQRQFVMIDPNVPGPVCLDSPKRIKNRFGSKYGTRYI